MGRAYSKPVENSYDLIFRNVRLFGRKTYVSETDKFGWFMLFHKRLIARQFEPKTALVSQSGSN